MDTTPAGRFYKSRKARPCDACRRRKVTCDMPTGPPCQRCLGKTLPCTFEQGPGKRKRPGAHPRHLHHSSQTVPLDVMALSEEGCPTTSSQVDQLLWTDHAAFLSFQAAVTEGQQTVNTPRQTQTQVQTTQTSQTAFFAGDDMSMMGDMNALFHLDQSGLETASEENALQSPLLSPPPPPPLREKECLQDETTNQDPFSTDGSLEFLPGAFSFYIGPTGVSDVHLLSRQRFGEGNITVPSVKGLKYRRMQSALTDRSRKRNQNVPVMFGLTDHALLEKAEPKTKLDGPATATTTTTTTTIPTTETDAEWTALWQILDVSTAWKLLGLYRRFVDPYFPIVARCQIPTQPGALAKANSCNSPAAASPPLMSLALLTALCATALPFVVYERSLYALLVRPLPDEALYRLCWRSIGRELHAPSLSTVQACLLLQQRLPTNQYLHDTAFSWSLMATTVAAAQTIGLHRDPSSWTDVPVWERRVRRRLWWAVWAVEKWVALARGMPSHLGRCRGGGGGGVGGGRRDDDDDEESDVAAMRSDDMEDLWSGSIHPTVARNHLLCLVQLTDILAEIQKTFYTLRATRETAGNLARSLELARSTRVRLREWRDALPFALQFRSSSNNNNNSSSSSSNNNTTTRLSIWSILDSSDEQHQQQLDGNASLHLSYIVTHMTLFRALLRPLTEADSRSNRSNSVNPGTQAVTRGALLCVREFVEFVEALTPVQWNAFWHGWSRANFAMAGSFMVQLLYVVGEEEGEGGEEEGEKGEKGEEGKGEGEAEVGKEDHTRSPRPGFADEYAELLGWIRRWRWASRVSANGAAGAKGLTNLGLVRVETMIGQLDSV